MKLRDEHTHCSLLEDKERAEMSNTGWKRNDNLKQKASPLQLNRQSRVTLQTSSREENDRSFVREGIQEAQKMVLQDVAGMIPESEPNLTVIPRHRLQLQGLF